MQCCGQAMCREDGMYVCTRCGRMGGTVLLTTEQSHTHYTWHAVSTYSRYRRCGQLLNRLTGGGTPIRELILKHVKAKKPKTIADVFRALQSLKGVKLLPYEKASTILNLCGGEKPIHLHFLERHTLLNQFKVMYDCWKRYGTVKFFPYFYLLGRFCETRHLKVVMGKDRAGKLKSYLRPLKCQKRHEIYSKQWDFLLNEMKRNKNELGGDLSTLFEV